MGKNKLLILEKHPIFILSIIFSVLLASFLISRNFTSFDMYTHLFFSKHYRQSWFSLIDYHVGGGLDLSTYPPLVYQIIAMLSLVFPIKISYYILLLFSWLGLSYFSSKFFVDYLKIKDQKLWITFLFIFFSTGILVTIFVFGQLTTIVGLSFGFASLYWFNKFLEEPIKKKPKYSEKTKHPISTNFLFSLFSLSLSAFSHNFSFLLISIFYLFIIFFEWKTVIKKLKGFLLYSILLLILILPVYYPLLCKASKSSLIPSEEIIHWSRNPFTTSLNFERWLSILGISSFMLIFPAILLLSKVEKGKYLKLYFVALFFFLVGLGRTTPLTNIFGGLEYWLTYERFSLVSSLIFTALLSLFIPDIPNIEVSYAEHKFNLLHLIFLTAFIFISIQWVYRSHELFFTRPVGHPMSDREEITDYVLAFLNEDQPNYRYQTFGYGRPIGELYFYSKLPTLDTDYYTGRTIEWIRDSGLDEIDQTRDGDFLREFMNNADSYSVKYIITFSDFYYQFMKNYNWELIKNKDFDGTIVMIWSNPNHLTEISFPKENITLLNYVWGILPPMVLFVFLFLLMNYNWGKQLR